MEEIRIRMSFLAFNNILFWSKQISTFYSLKHEESSVNSGVGTIFTLGEQNL